MYTPPHTRLFATSLLIAALAAAPGCLWPLTRPDPEGERVLREGNEALSGGRYDEAIAKYDEGLARRPGELSYLVNKAAALRARGVARFNSAIALRDADTRAAGREAARRDIGDAAALAGEAVARLKSSPWAGTPQARLTAFSARAAALRLLAGRFDPARADEALAATYEYLRVEQAPEARLKARLELGQTLLDAGRGAHAASEYKKILAEEPDNLDAVLGAGLGLSQSGDAAACREAAVYLRRFIAQAPDGHPLKASAGEALSSLPR